MKKLFTFLLLLLIGNGFAQKTVNEISIVGKELPSDFEYLSAVDSLGNRALLKTSSLALNKTQSLMKLPYPILFIHGLGSDCTTWNTFTNYLDVNYGFTWGGTINYCLNDDGSNYTTNENFYPTSGADIALYTPSLIIGDYYYINFDIGSDGSFSPPYTSSANVLSNQSAIDKQGAAVAQAVYLILQKTGRDKVILMGHSMGGLAAREYLQNWTQTDGLKHIGKLATTGTPHGGSDEVTFGIQDCQSEAYRDLRTTYSGSGSPGIYLFGGVENNTVTDLTFCSNFYNVDVNCNGTVNENVTGLNNKAIPLDLSYSCVIGTGSVAGGDGAVGATQANLNWYKVLTFPADTFILERPSGYTGLWHTQLPSQIVGNLNLLDEPNEYILSYGINYGITYTGFTTRQTTNGYSYDYDDYKFTATTNGNVNVNINNIALADLMVHIVDMSGNTVGSIQHSSGFSNISFNQYLTAGNYYLEIYGVPTSNSWDYPYNFVLNSSATSITEITEGISFSVFPNPTNNNVSIFMGRPSSELKISITNSFGQLVYLENTNSNNGKIDLELSSLSSGIYFINVSSKNESKTQKLIINK